MWRGVKAECHPGLGLGCHAARMGADVIGCDAWIAEGIRKGSGGGLLCEAALRGELDGEDRGGVCRPSRFVVWGVATV
jgi:hypothetical protein